jgi:hypothetical protein
MYLIDNSGRERVRVSEVGLYRRKFGFGGEVYPQPNPPKPSSREVSQYVSVQKLKNWMVAGDSMSNQNSY